tara:strand:+ start:16781 stop:18574 length:1794 start_codon:yes stop_codon:yes gene_type:complete
MAIFNLTDREFQNVLDIGGRGISAAGSFLQSRSTAATLDANAQIAALNVQEIAETLPIQIEGIESEIVSEREAAAIQERRTARDLSVAQRQAGLSQQSFAAQRELVTLSRDEIELRSGINERLLGTTLEAITIRANERVRQLSRDRRDQIAAIRAAAAAGGVEVTSGSIEAAEADVQEDIGAEIGAIRAEQAVSLEEARIRDELTDSATREQLGGADERLAQIDLEFLQLEGLLEDAVFDAALESEINLRNRDINIARLERSRELLERKAAIGIETFQRQEERFEDQERDQLLSQIASGAGFGIDVLSKFPTLASKLGDLIGVTGGGSGGAGGLETAISSAAAEQFGGAASSTATNVADAGAASGTGPGASNLLSPGSFAGDFASGVSATLGGTTLSSGLVSFQSGLGAVGGLQGATTAFASGATLGQALGVVAPPVAAILGIPIVANLLKGDDNDALARTQATDKVVQILQNPTAANLERAKALLGLPNTFEDPSPRTKAKFDFVEGAINRAGGITTLSPAAQEVFLAAIQRRADLREEQEQAARRRLGLPATNQQLNQPIPGGEGQTFGDTAAGRLIRQGLTPRQAEERLRSQGE